MENIELTGKIRDWDVDECKAVDCKVEYFISHVKTFTMK